jgi:hypothetical protein
MCGLVFKVLDFRVKKTLYPKPKTLKENPRKNPKTKKYP